MRIKKKWNWYFIYNDGYRAENETAFFSFTEAGTFPIALVVTNTWGCKDTVVKSLKVEADYAAYIPDVFTPNGDNLNDNFLPVLRSVKLYELAIYNRAGTQLFFTKDTREGWDGSFKGEICKSDIYIWKITLSSFNGETKTLTGQVLLNQ